MTYNHYMCFFLSYHRKLDVTFYVVANDIFRSMRSTLLPIKTNYKR